MRVQMTVGCLLQKNSCVHPNPIDLFGPVLLIHN